MELSLARSPCYIITRSKYSNRTVTLIQQSGRYSVDNHSGIKGPLATVVGGAQGKLLQLHPPVCGPEVTCSATFYRLDP